MSTKKYLSLDKLSIFLEHLKSTFATLTHNHTISEITDLIIDDEVAATSNLVKNSAVNSALNNTKAELNNAIEDSIKYTDTKIASLINSAPETLDTLGELATAFGENKEVVDVLNEAIVNKQNKNVIVYRDTTTRLASMTAPEIMEKVRTGDNLYYAPSLQGGTMHPYLEGSDSGVFFYSNYIDNNRVIGTGILIDAAGNITNETYQLKHLNDTTIHITADEREKWNNINLDDYYSKTETDDLLNSKANYENPTFEGSMGLNYTGELGFASASLGFANEASGMYCFSEGMGNKSTGNASHTEGTANIASSDAAHAEGYGTEASNVGAHTEGAYTKATGYGSHAEGSGTIASGEGQHVEGRYNIEDLNYVHILGNGTSDTNRSNAHTIDNDGNAWFSGDVYVSSTSGINQDEGSKKLATEDYVEALYKKLNSNTVLGFYCIEDVTIVTNGISKVYPANSNVEVTFIEDDVFEIIPTSDNSILSLTAFPNALGTYYPWLEGVKQFSNILFDMNAEDMYSKWSQGNQGSYQVQYAQYTNCIFWSDNAYISDVSKRTNYTLYYTSQLPLCYSTIPDNTFKAFYLAFNVNNDPNWGNKVYRDSFAKATWATQVFSYYGARTIGIFGHDDPDFNIILPKDCRGLMYAATAIENAGTFDAVNTTNFGAKSGSWREAFGQCSSLRNLYIKNLQVNLNISWSPINYDSIYFIISKATNTNAITITVSPYTYNLLGSSDFELAASKNITIALLADNYVEDRRLSDIINKADKTDVLLKTEQTLTNDELQQVRKNLRFIGKDVEGQQFTIDGETVTASPNAEIFGDYNSNIAVGQWSIAEGSGTVAKGRASHAEGAMTQALVDGTHTEGYSTKATGYWSHAEGEMTIVTSYASHAEGSYCTMPDGSKRYTTASGYASHSEGGGCHTTGSCAHAEGLGSTASGNQAHVEGRYTIAAGSAQHVEGVANIEDTENKYIHIAGNGTLPTDRSNAHTLDWDGNAEFMGDVIAHGCSSTESPISLINVNSLVESLQTEIDDLSEITSEEIRNLFT